MSLRRACGRPRSDTVVAVRAFISRSAPPRAQPPLACTIGAMEWLDGHADGKALGGPAFGEHQMRGTASVRLRPPAKTARWAAADGC